MKYGKLSIFQLAVLLILWKSIKSQSSEEIIEQLNLGFEKSFLAEYITEIMISKGLIIKTGEYYAKRHEDSVADYLYSPSIFLRIICRQIYSEPANKFAHNS